jgi:hypothetical protein
MYVSVYPSFFSGSNLGFTRGLELGQQVIMQMVSSTSNYRPITMELRQWLTRMLYIYQHVCWASEE